MSEPAKRDMYSLSDGRNLVIEWPADLQRDEWNEVKQFLDLFIRKTARIITVRENAHKMQSCCECGADYPQADLEAGHLYCPKCRAKYK